MELFADDIRMHRNKKNVEIEIRLGKLNNNYFDTNVGQTTFTRIIKALDKYDSWEDVRYIEDEVFYWDNGVRCIYNGENVVYQEKRVIKKKNLKFDILDVRLGISQENPTTEQSSDAKYTVTRKRKSYIRKNVRIDMTIVTGEPVDKDDEEVIKYQVELEILDASSDQKIYSALYKVNNILELLK